MGDDKSGQCAHGYYGLCPHCYDSLRAELAELRAQVSAQNDRLAHIAEYWNGERNDQAMYDALCHIVDEAGSALPVPPAAVPDVFIEHSVMRPPVKTAAVPEDVAKYRHHLELLRDYCTYPSGHVDTVVLNGHRMEIIRDALAAILAKIDASKGEVPLPLSALVCVGRARFPRTGGNAGISWHVEDALSDTGGFRSGNPCNGELLFVLPATAKRAMLAASGRQENTNPHTRDLVLAQDAKRGNFRALKKDEPNG